MIQPRQLRRVAVAAAGTSVLGVGVAMIVLPGPALLVIPAGLGILALEFDWARGALREVRRRFAAARAAGSRGGARRSPRA